MELGMLMLLVVVTGTTIIRRVDAIGPPVSPQTPDDDGLFAWSNDKQKLSTAIPSDRIQGGQRVSIEDYSWYAPVLLLTDDGRLLYECGGILIGELYVMTAASCIRNTTAVGAPEFDGLFGFHVGFYCRSFSTNCGRKSQIIAPAEYYFPPRFEEDLADGMGWRSDIAIAKLSRRAKRDIPYAVPDDGTLLTPARDLQAQVGTYFRLVANGYETYDATTKRGTVSRYLQQIDMPLITTSECEEKWLDKPGDHGASVFCLEREGEPMPAGACFDDFGSPAIALRSSIQTNNSEKPEPPPSVVVGILSALSVRGCPEAPNGFNTPPDIYTKVSSFYPFIVNVVCANSRKRPPSWCPCVERKAQSFELNALTGKRKKCSWLRRMGRTTRYCNTNFSDASQQCPITCDACL